ncbi:MAG: 2-phospho-L-lactate transferase [Caldilineaceae bacterium]|nr:2-phospho-L-lactate transferase [Caldilineaceae bacterium]
MLSSFTPGFTQIRVTALAGGVGGAKLAVGLQQILPPGALTVIVNTGDDFEHWGLHVCPDLDTVLYNLATINNPEMGWGRQEEKFTVLDEMDRYGGDQWFRIGDKDLALHLRRTEWMRQGVSLSEVTDRLRRMLGVPSTILPMCNEPVRTLVHTDEGDLPFQHYFVRRRCEPTLVDLSFLGAERAKLSNEIKRALDRADLVVFCPSNPYVSIDPILAVPGMRDRLCAIKAPKIGVSPIVSGQALKGPAAKMMRELGEMISPVTVVDHLGDLLDGFVIDAQDRDLCEAVILPTLTTDTIMVDLESKAELARAVVEFGLSLHANHMLSPIDQPSLQ